MTLKGRIFMWLFIFMVGFGCGVLLGRKSVVKNSGETINVSMDGKVKKGAEVLINVDKTSSDDNSGGLFKRKKNKK